MIARVSATASGSTLARAELDREAERRHTAAASALHSAVVQQMRRLQADNEAAAVARRGSNSGADANGGAPVRAAQDPFLGASVCSSDVYCVRSFLAPCLTTAANKILLDALPSVEEMRGGGAGGVSRAEVQQMLSNPSNTLSSFWEGCCCGFFFLPCYAVNERRRLRHSPRPHGGFWRTDGTCGDFLCGFFCSCCSTHQVSQAVALNITGHTTVGSMMASLRDPSGTSRSSHQEKATLDSSASEDV